MVFQGDGRFFDWIVLLAIPHLQYEMQSAYSVLPAKAGLGIYLANTLFVTQLALVRYVVGRKGPVDEMIKEVRMIGSYRHASSTFN